MNKCYYCETTEKELKPNKNGTLVCEDCQKIIDKTIKQVKEI